MSSNQLFPASALAILRKAHYDEKATRNYEILSGGFWWSDELLRDVATVCMEVDSYAYGYVMAYRASISTGTPRDDLRGAWDQLLLECPDWPGFRPERCATTLARDLHEESIRTLAQLDALPD